MSKVIGLVLALLLLVSASPLQAEECHALCNVTQHDTQLSWDDPIDGLLLEVGVEYPHSMLWFSAYDTSNVIQSIDLPITGATVYLRYLGVVRGPYLLARFRYFPLVSRPTQ